jgi:transcriptional regulator with PAS, ATPase and Fis domain
LESELFGYVHGAFTGASSQGKPGLFEIADKGTLFLDEIAELPMALQSKLLRVLERGEVQRLGATSSHRMNVRIIAATNKDLKQMVQQKMFRDDIYYRLNVVPINLPPLRRRPEDIPVLANKFLEELNRKYGYKRTLSLASMHALAAYNWPGNVRELRNVIERLVIISTQDELALDAQFALGDVEPLASAASAAVDRIDLIPKNTEGSVFRYQGTLKSVRESIENQYIQQVLGECDGRMTEAARRLGMHRTMLYRRVARIAKEK